MNLKKIFSLTLLIICFCLALSGCGESAGKTPAEPMPTFSAGEVAADTTDLDIVLQSGETELLDNLTNLETADFSGSTCVEEIYQWAQENPHVDVSYTVTLPDGTVLESSAWKADLSKMSGSDIEQAAESLALLPKLKSIDLGTQRPGLDWDNIAAVQAACPDATVKYLFDLYGKQTDLQNTQINLSHIEVSDGGAAVKEAMAYMPNLTYLDMDSCGVSNEDMAAIRDAFPDVKVVWRIWFGSTKLYTVRTDVEMILASKPSTGCWLDGSNATELQYCTDVRFLDLGHNYPLTDISFVEHMPKLQVLIVASAQLSDLSPLASCPELEYLEIQSTNCADLSPLSGLEKLEHLNVACIYSLNDISPLYSLKKLERLWIGRENGVTDKQLEEMQKAVPGCEINTTIYKDPTSGGWRYDENGYQVQRYYLLRLQFEGYQRSSYAFPENDPLY